MKCQITMDQHRDAFDWLEDHLEESLYTWDTDEIIALIEQVVMR